MPMNRAMRARKVRVVRVNVEIYNSLMGGWNMGCSHTVYMFQGRHSLILP